MAQRVGLVYGKPKVRKLQLDAGSNISAMTLVNHSATQTVGINGTISKEISPGELVELSAGLPSDSVSSQLYHDTTTPKEGNYYYNDNTVYTFVNWTNSAGTVMSTNATYSFNMPVNDLALTANGSYTITEINKVYAIPITVLNQSADDEITKVYGTLNGTTTEGTSSATFYIWPSTTITVGANLKANTTSDFEYENCDEGDIPLRPTSRKYKVDVTYFIKAIASADGTHLSNPNGTSTTTSVSVYPNAARTYSVTGSRSSTTNYTNCASSVSSWTLGATNGSSTTTSSVRSTKYWWPDLGENVSSHGTTETFGTEVQSRSLSQYSVYSTNGASSSKSVTRSDVILGKTVNGVAAATSYYSTMNGDTPERVYSLRSMYATVGSQTWGSTNGASTTSASRRTTSSSWSTYYGSASASAGNLGQYTASNFSTYGTSHYMSTYPITEKLYSIYSFNETISDKFGIYSNYTSRLSILTQGGCYLNDIVYEFISNRVEQRQFTTNNYSKTTSIAFYSSIGGGGGSDYNYYKITFSQNDTNYFYNGMPYVQILSSYFNKINSGIKTTINGNAFLQNFYASYTRKGTVKIDDYVKQTILKGYSQNLFKINSFTTKNFHELFVFYTSNGFDGENITNISWMTNAIFTSLQASNVRDMVLYYGSCSFSGGYFYPGVTYNGIFTIPQPVRPFNNIHSVGSKSIGKFSTARRFSDAVTDYYTIASFTNRMLSMIPTYYSPSAKEIYGLQNIISATLTDGLKTINVYQSSEVVSNIGKQTVTYDIVNG